MTCSCGNIFNPRSALIWAAGINGMATQAVAALLKDLVTGRRELPESVIGWVVVPQVSAQDSSSLKEYYRRLRISRYRIVHAVDVDGNPVNVQ
jgi:hypothetical protein